MVSEKPETRTGGPTREPGHFGGWWNLQTRWVQGVRLLPRGIRGRLFLLITLALLPVLVLQGWISYQHYTTRRSQALQMEFEVAQGVATTFSAYVEGLRERLDTVGQAILTFSSYDEAKAQRVLQAMTARHETLGSVNWVSPAGIILASTLPRAAGHDLSTQPYFQQVLAGAPWSLGDLAPEGIAIAEPAFALVVAVHDERGALRGAVVASIEPMHLGELTLTQQRPAGGVYVIYDRQGRLVYRHPETPLTWEQRTQRRRADPLLPSALGGEPAWGEVPSPYSDGRCFAARVPIAGAGWVAGANRPVCLVLAPVRRGLREEALLASLVACLAFLLAYLLARTIAGPLRRLEQDSQTLGAGQTELPADPEAPTEVRHLRGTVIQMAIDLIRRAEALRESERSFKSTFENAAVGIAHVALDGRFLQVNDQFCQITQYSHDELLARRCLDITHPEDAPQSLNHWRRLRDGRIDHYSVEKRYLRKDGSVVWVNQTGSARRSDAGAPEYFIVFLQDISWRKRAEETLHASEQRYRQLFEANLAGTYLTRLDGTILDFNEAMMKMLGYASRDEVFQHNSLDFYAEPAFRQELVRLLQRDGIVPGKEAVLRRKDGSTLYALGYAVVVRNEQTGEPYIQGVAIDITERKHAEQALHELTRTLESKVAQRTAELERRANQLQKLAVELSEAEDRERKRLAEILHDDLQQQLAAAKFHLGLMRNHVRGQDNLRRDIVEIDAMLKDAIQMSRSLSHDLSPAILYHGDLGEALEWLASQMGTKHGLAVRVHTDGAVCARSEALKSFLYKAAQEMLFNVVKHAQVQEASLRVRRAGQWICLLISDRGRGFDPQELPDASGSGLLTVRERVELLGGRLKIKSAKGKGSTFFLVVPDTPKAEDTVAVGSCAYPMSATADDPEGK